jgi:predicted ArsR family transcriptional regulator
LKGADELRHNGVVKNIEPGQPPAAQATAGSNGEGLTHAGAEHDPSTRRRVARSVLEHGPSTAADLASRLNVTPAAIRRHLDALLDCGHVVSATQRSYGGRSRGRPAKVFSLTDAGRADFYQAYDELAIQALRALAEAGGEQAVNRLAQRRQADIEQRFAGHSQEHGSPGFGATEALAQALSDAGYAATAEPALAGQQVCQHHCPVANVAAAFPQLCEAETQMFSRLLGVHVQRLATIAHGDGVCTTHVPAGSEGVRETFRTKFTSQDSANAAIAGSSHDRQPTSRKASPL